MPNAFNDIVFIVFIFRFKEREENVKADIFHAFVALLKQTKPSIAMQHHPGQSTELMDLGDEGPVGQLMSQVKLTLKPFLMKSEDETN